MKILFSILSIILICTCIILLFQGAKRAKLKKEITFNYYDVLKIIFKNHKSIVLLFLCCILMLPLSILSIVYNSEILLSVFLCGEFALLEVILLIVLRIVNNQSDGQSQSPDGSMIDEK